MKNENNNIKIDNEKAYLQKGILVLDALETLNYKEREYLLNKYPISAERYIKKLFGLSNLRPLFEFSVDNQIGKLTKAILDYNGDEAKRNYILMFADYCIKVVMDNSKHPLNPNYKYFRSYNSFGQLKETHPRDVLKTFFDKIEEDKEREKVINEISEEHLRTLLYTDEEMFVIKFCKRLETYLKFKYDVTKTFEENLTSFTNSDKCLPEFKDLLHKVRKNRNNIVHSSTEERYKISKEEYSNLIDYICNL